MNKPKQFINSVCTKCIAYYRSRQLQRVSHAFPTSVPYVSQFISIYPASLSPETVLINEADREIFGAKDEREFTFWAWRDCAIACLHMILLTHDIEESLMNLTNACLAIGGYIIYDKNHHFIDKGWFHKPLVHILKNYGIYAYVKKWQSAESIAYAIEHNKLVMASLLLPRRRDIKEDGSFEAKEGAHFSGHIVLVTEVVYKGKKLIGFHIHDPRGMRAYQAHTFIPIAMFNRYFSHRSIVIS